MHIYMLCHKNERKIPCNKVNMRMRGTFLLCYISKLVHEVAELLMYI